VARPGTDHDDERLRAEARRALASELARKVSARLAALAVYGGSCPCNHAELRAHLAELRRIAKNGS
jgi:hypothetical protein